MSEVMAYYLGRNFSFEDLLTKSESLKALEDLR